MRVRGLARADAPEVGQFYRNRQRGHVVRVERLWSEGPQVYVGVVNVENGRYSAAKIENFTKYPIRYLKTAEGN